jgi:hypothetical protein
MDENSLMAVYALCGTIAAVVMFVAPCVLIVVLAKINKP